MARVGNGSPKHDHPLRRMNRALVVNLAKTKSSRDKRHRMRVQAIKEFDAAMTCDTPDYQAEDDAQ